jgi:hypothetical protein
MKDGGNVATFCRFDPVGIAESGLRPDGAPTPIKLAHPVQELGTRGIVGA